jgi:hypothetical protein
MKKELLQKFVQKHPNHYLTPYFSEILSNETVEFNSVRDRITLALNSGMLSVSMIQQTDILLANLSMARN